MIVIWKDNEVEPEIWYIMLMQYLTKILNALGSYFCLSQNVVNITMSTVQYDYMES